MNKRNSNTYDALGIEKGAEWPPASPSSPPELGGDHVELNRSPKTAEPFSTLPHLVETSRKPSDDHEKYLLGVALQAMQDTEDVLGN